MTKFTVINVQRVTSSWQLSVEPRTVCFAVINATVKLPEAGQSGRSHPNNQILILKAVVVFVVWIKLPQFSGPSDGTTEVLKR